MIDIASILPSLLVYALLLFAAFILIRQIRKMMRGDIGCSNCPSGTSCCSRSSDKNCCNDKKIRENELKTIQK